MDRGWLQRMVRRKLCSLGILNAVFSADLNDPIHVGTARLGKFLRAPGKEDLYSARGSVNENALR